MANRNLDDMLDRIHECAAGARSDELSRNLLHAYVACLSARELCKAAVRELGAQGLVAGAIRNRLMRIGGDGYGLEEIDQLAGGLVGIRPSDAKERARVEALLSHIYPMLPPGTRRVLLDRWQSRGTKSAGARWLKAIADDELLFSVNHVLEYWRDTGDYRAARLVVDHANPIMIAEILPELIDGCDEGWVVSRAMMRCGSISEEIWIAIRAKFPATYAYLC